jgi:hypothetical protein
MKCGIAYSDFIQIHNFINILGLKINLLALGCSFCGSHISPKLQPTDNAGIQVQMK